MMRILFVCVGNAGRSQMAEALFNHLVQGKAIALSAGTNPAERVDPSVTKVMQETGIDISGNRPKMLAPEMKEQADKVITMGCGVEGVCPATFVETEDWGVEDPRCKPIDRVREIRDVIKKKVIRLIEEMAN
ncbi:MAG: arsenate reductase ArsC [Dehalococcoidia bacterium]|nr:MAG: arsenate reductase ArsC [Dehalococcoidia bacterium]